jgi:hypothetical protein
MPFSIGMIELFGPTAGANDLMASSRSNALQLSSGLHGRWILQRHVAVRALDDEARARQLAGAPRPDQEGDVTAGLQQPATEIAADGAGADHENTHVRTPLLLRMANWK